jgi:5-methylcytosine-specific restriction endonuclease McrA
MVSLAKGGTNSIDNVVPACKPCNDKKYTASVEAFQAREQKRR